MNKLLFFNIRYLSVLSAAAMMIVAGAAHAQLSPALDGQIDPGRFQERVEEPEIPEDIVIDEEESPVLIVPEVDPKEGFELKELDVEGVTAFSEEEISAITDPHTGKIVNLATLQYLAKRITQKYLDAGYFLSKATVPEQCVSDGRSVIRVIECHSCDVVIQDVAGIGQHDVGEILHRLKHKIQSMKPLHGPTVERYMLLLNDLGTVKADAIMQPLPDDKAVAGAVKVTIKINKIEHQSRVSIDNHGSRFTGPYQLNASTQFRPGFATLDSMQFTTLGSIPFDEVRYLEGKYDTMLNTEGLQLTVGGNISISEPGFTLQSSNIESASYQFNAGLTYPIVRSRKQNLSVSGSVDMRNVSVDAAGIDLTKDRIRAIRLSTRFDNIDKYRGFMFGSATFSQGLDVLAARETGSSNLSRDEGESDFTKLEVSLGRLQVIADEWRLYLRGRGQFSADQLLSSEEFSYGGQAYGRAYSPSEITGDSGIVGAAELSYNIGETMPDLFLQPFAFYDIGKVWNRDNGGSSASGSSAGTGLRFNYGEYFNGAVAVAWPLTRDIESPLDGDPQGPRYLFKLGTEF